MPMGVFITPLSNSHWPITMPLLSFVSCCSPGTVASQLPSSFTPINHLLYADDTYVVSSSPASCPAPAGLGLAVVRLDSAQGESP